MTGGLLGERRSEKERPRVARDEMMISESWARLA
jgi:hypothetical protein